MIESNAEQNSEVSESARLGSPAAVSLSLVALGAPLLSSMSGEGGARIGLASSTRDAEQTNHRRDGGSGTARERERERARFRSIAVPLTTVPPSCLHAAPLSALQSHTFALVRLVGSHTDCRMGGMLQC